MNVLAIASLSFTKAMVNIRDRTAGKPSRSGKFAKCVKMAPSNLSAITFSGHPCNSAGESGGPKNAEKVTTVVVNVRRENPDVYCGRPSIYGNPFHIGKDGTRLEVIAKYIDYFLDRLARDANFRKQIHALKGKRIGCWCDPDLCHLHVVAFYLDHYVDNIG